MYRASVIIPVYNAEKTLARCVESILFGKERNIEILLLDDCSKDRSWELCCAYAEKYENIRAFRNDVNRGVSYTRNRGLDEATGEYILFVDSDDWVSGDYTAILLDEADKDISAISVCGFRFIDYLRDSREDYVWESGTGAVTVVPVTDAFRVHKKTLLQQLWTKVFQRKVVVDSQLRFDENMSIGEDFQFVLDYMEAGKVSGFRITDRALYYYIRSGGSLMDNFGLTEQNDEFERLERLGRITGDRNRATEAITETKQSYVYHAMRSKLPYGEKKRLAEQLLGDRAAQFCRQQHLMMYKERILRCLSWGRTLLASIKGKFRQVKNHVSIVRARRKLNARDFTVLSQNCIGGVLYHDLNMAFSSPTINLYLDAPDFISFAEDPKRYLDMDLQMVWSEEYPIGHLGPITIHFMHYGSCTQAFECWQRRAKRINFDRIVLLCTDRDRFSEEVFERWKKLPYPKLLFTANPAFKDTDSVYYSEYEHEKKVPDLIPKREFYAGDKLIQLINNRS